MARAIPLKTASTTFKNCAPAGSGAVSTRVEPVTSAITLLDTIRRVSCLDMCQEAASHDRYSRDKWRFLPTSKSRSLIISAVFFLSE